MNVMNREPGDLSPCLRASVVKILLLVTSLLLTACGNAPTPPAPPPPKVTVARPVEREVVEWDEYTARLEAVDSVEVRARVSGYLESVHFADGAMVQEGRPAVHHRSAAVRGASASAPRPSVALAKARLESGREEPDARRQAGVEQRHLAGGGRHARRRGAPGEGRRARRRGGGRRGAARRRVHRGARAGERPRRAASW